MLPNLSSIALEELGWSSFQDLAVAYAEDFFGAPFISYAKGRDGGSDGQDTLFTPLDVHTPRRVLQAKHTSSPSNLTASEFALELAKLPSLAAEGFGAYILVTNHTVTRVMEKELRALAIKAGFTEFEAHGRSQLVRRIRSSSSLRALAPRLYGIGDLSQILDERRLAQAEVLLATSRTDMERFVATEAYRDSVRALRDGGIVVLLGAPAVGKSTIARALSVAALDTFRATPLILESIAQISDHWHPGDPARLFWVDDVFGPTQVTAGAADTFNRLIPVLKASLAQGNKFVFTSRVQIWRAVRDDLKLHAAPNVEKALIEIKVEDYSPRDRAQIVYNHVKLGDQDLAWRRAFKHLAPMVASHAAFTPEVARRFGLQTFTVDLAPSIPAVDAFVRNPAAYLEALIAGMSDASKAGLALILTSGGRAPTAFSRTPTVNLVCEGYDVRAAQISKALDALEGSLCVREVHDGEPCWAFRHPTIGEAVATVAARTPALLDIYLGGTDVRRILSEAVCAGVAVEGAIIVIGVSRYKALLARIRAAGPLIDTRTVRAFLIVRATPEFRQLYFTEPFHRRHSLSGRFALEPQVMALVAVLAPEGLVDPEYLRTMKADIHEGIAEHGVIDCLSDWARSILGEEAFAEAVECAIASLRDGGDTFMDYWSPNISASELESPSDAFSGLTAFIEGLEAFVDGDEAAEVLAIMQPVIDGRVAYLERELEEASWRQNEEEEYYRSRNQSPRPSPTSLRGRGGSSLFSDRTPDTADIFSDIDE